MKRIQLFLQKHGKGMIVFLLIVLLFILIVKQLDVYDRLVSIYQSCLPILMGGVVAFLLQPIIDRVHRHVSLRTAVLLVYIGILVLLVALLLLLIPIMYKQISDFIGIIPSWFAKAEGLMKKFHFSYDELAKLKNSYMKEGYGVILHSLKSTLDTTTSYGIAYMTGFFISIDLAFWKRTAKKIIPNFHQFTTFYKTMSTIVYQYLVGTFFDLLFIAVSVGIVLYLAGYPNALMYAILLALLNLFPYIGATIGLLLIALVGVLSYPSFPLVPFVIIWLIQQLESNVIQPWIFNRTMKVRPILTFIFIFISDAFFGVVGVILSPIFAAIAQIAFRSYLHSKTSDAVGEWDEIWQDFDEVMKEESY